MKHSTSDTTLAGHLINRGFPLLSVDLDGPRWAYLFAISDTEMDRELSWFIRHAISDTRCIANALSAIGKGHGTHSTNLEYWPDLAVAVKCSVGRTEPTLP